MPIWFKSKGNQSVVEKLLQDKENLILSRMEHDAQLALIDKKLEYFKNQETINVEKVSMTSMDDTGLIAAR